MTANPYQDIIDWLRSPEGERWSEHRIATAHRPSEGQGRLTRYGYVYGPLYMGGVLCVKDG